MKPKIAFQAFLLVVTLSFTFADKFDHIENFLRSEKFGLLKRTIEAYTGATTYAPTVLNILSKPNNETYDPEIDIIEELEDVTFDTNSTCSQDLMYTMDSILSQVWAFKMLDSAGKIPSGVTKGATKWLGDYDGCLDITAPPYNSTEELSLGFKGRYCMGQLSTINAGPLGIGINIGICVPSTCNAQDLMQDWENFKNFTESIPYVGDLLKKLPGLTGLYCYPKPEEVKYDSASIACIVIIVIVCFVVVTASLYDAYLKFVKGRYVQVQDSVQSGSLDKQVEEEETSSSPEQTEPSVALIQPEKQNGKLLDIWLAFSVFGNAKAILDTSRREGQLDCVHGIRFLSLAWVILGHTLSQCAGSINNIMDVLVLFNSYWFQAILQATFSVDTFFLLSGFLMTYLILKDQRVMKWTSWLYFYAHRFIRLTPVYMMMLFLFTTLFNYLGDGPLWGDPAVMEKANMCTTTWWYNLLYINNFLDGAKQCMGWAWYLANDMQFFAISPIFLIALKSQKYRFVGLITIGVLLLISWITTAVLSTQHEFPIIFDGLTDPNAMNKTLIEFDILYTKPWIRIGPYLIGALLAYLLLETKRLKWKIHSLVVVVGWAAAIAINITLVYGLYKKTPGVGVSALYNTVARSVWAMTVSWVIYACITDNAGPVNKLLSWPLWFPLSRLTYCAYLVHPMVLAWYFAMIRVPIYFSLPTVALYYLGIMVLSYGLAFLVSIVFEGPVMKIEKILRQ